MRVSPVDQSGRVSAYRDPRREGRWAARSSSQRSIRRFIDFVLDNLFGPKYTIVKTKLQVKRNLKRS
jgi:hypothetical protein